MRSKRTTVVTAVLAGALLTTLVPQASAHQAYGVKKIDKPSEWGGAGWVTPSALNNHPLCVNAACPNPTGAPAPNPVDQGNVVSLWQRILYVDGYGPFTSRCEVDGRYGANAKANTFRWQQRESLDFRDGMVGWESWWFAQKHVVRDNWDQNKTTSSESWYRYRGTGAHGSVGLYHSTTSSWGRKNMYQHHNNLPYTTNHPSIEMCGCSGCETGGGGGGCVNLSPFGIPLA